MSLSPQPGPALSQSNSQLAALLSQSYREIENLKNELGLARRRAENAEKQITTFKKYKDGDHFRAFSELEAKLEHAEMARDEAEARRHIITEHWNELERKLQAIDMQAADARAGFHRVVQEGGGQLVVAPMPLQHQQTMLMPPPTRGHVTRSSHRSLQTISLPPPPNAHPSGSNTLRVRHRAESTDDTLQPPAKRSRSTRERSRDTRPNADSQVQPAIFYATNDDREEYLRQHTLSRTSSNTLPPVNNHRQHRHHRSNSRDSSRSAASEDIDDVILEAATSDTLASQGQQQPSLPQQRSPYPTSPANPPAAANNTNNNNNNITPRSAPHAEPGQVHTYQTHIFAPPVTGAPVKKSKFASSPAIISGAAVGVGPGVPGSAPQAAPANGINGTNISTNGSGVFTPAPSAVHATPAAPTPVTVASFPATNEAGQRICRQCGMPGRYKEGKCVEKWGPGPAGPGTVCDRCRKKMKRVERRGTMESATAAANAAAAAAASASVASAASLASVNGTASPNNNSNTGINGSRSPHQLNRDRAVHRTDTVIAQPAPSHYSPQQQQQQQQQHAPQPHERAHAPPIGPGGTHILPGTSFAREDPPRPTSSHSLNHHPYPHSGPGMQGHVVGPGKPAPPRRISPGLPSIATLPGSSEDTLEVPDLTGCNTARSRSRAPSRPRSHRPSPAPGYHTEPNGHPLANGVSIPAKRSPLGADTMVIDSEADGEAEPDADGDAEMEMDGDGDAEEAEAALFEAVDAAEAMKKED